MSMFMARRARERMIAQAQGNKKILDEKDENELFRMCSYLGIETSGKESKNQLIGLLRKNKAKEDKVIENEIKSSTKKAPVKDEPKKKKRNISFVKIEELKKVALDMDIHIEGMKKNQIIKALKKKGIKQI